MARFFTLIVALWAVVLSAPLCVSGMVEHPCQMCQTDACSHEINCSQDPCSLKVSQNDTSKTLSSHVYLDALPLLYGWLTPVALAFSLQEKAWTDAALLPRNAWPYPMGAFPLLI
jgi:hypothetical protein